MTTAKYIALALAMGSFAGAESAHAQVPRRHDLVVDFLPGTTAALTLGSGSSTVLIQGGQASLTVLGDSYCAASPSVGCSVLLNLLKFQVSDLEGAELTIDGDPYYIDIINPVITLAGPGLTTYDGSGFDIPSGLTTSTRASLYGTVLGHTFTGEPMLRDVGSTDGVIVRYTLFPDQLFALDVSATVIVDIMGTLTEGTINFFAAGIAPFRNTAPLVYAGPDQTVACGETVTLTGSSEDLEGDSEIVEYRWLDENGILLSNDPVAAVSLAPGAHALTLEAEDAHGAVGWESVDITLAGDDGTPHFESVPADVTATHCGAIDIGTAVAKTDCGDGVTVTSDAPATFPAGVTYVTWTATSGGATVSATQRVFVELGDDPACCPAGSNVIVGTSNNDTLWGTTGRDCIFGRGGQDFIYGRGGNDVISAGEGDDKVWAGLGNDSVNCGSGQDQVWGADGEDFLVGDDGDDKLYGESGNDVLSGGQGQDELWCGPGNDGAFGGTGDDRMYGEDGDDSLDGEENNNQCTGGNGFDTMLRCAAQDTPESTGKPPFPGEPSYDVCDCRPEKCSDCSSQADQCDAVAGCAEIIECVAATGSCNLPHECSALCETGRSGEAISVARQLASCFGGC